MKKLIALLLTFVLILSVVPFTASATESSNILYFDANSAQWTDFSQVYCHIYAFGGDSFFRWQQRAEKCIDNGDGTWSYNLDDHGITLATNETYFCIFSNNKGNTTYQLALSNLAFGHTAYCVDICEDPIDYQRNVQIVNWNDIDPKVLGPELAITQRAEIVGTIVPHETSKVEILAEWLKKCSLIWASMDLGLTEQEVLDNLKIELGFTDDDVMNAVELSNSDVNWSPKKGNLTLNERRTVTIPAGSCVSLYFTAEELSYGEYYSFKSQAEDCNPYCEMYESGVFCNSSDDFKNSYDFNIIDILCPERTYKFVVSCHDDKDVTFDVMLTVVDEEVIPDYEYKILNNNSIEIGRYNSYDETVVSIPKSIDGFTVTAIGEFAFKEMLMEEVIVPDTVINIRDYAFVHAYNLKTVSIPESVENIGQGVFYGCDNLEKVTILNKNCRIVDDCAPPANTIFDETTIPENATIYGYTGSTAEEYANKYGRKFVALDDPTKPTQPALGDVDGDGDISVMDATGIQLHIASLEILEGNAIIVADADGDGNVSIMDATQIQLFIAKLIPEL